MFETTTTNTVEQTVTDSSEMFHELAETQLALIGGGAGIALFE
ncbi:MAG TPA: hypothetical protein VFE23_15185 [Usitatibacter sp.]|jgi:hypothetical protein|nr:hypothetical protein [Usitatibacter sp.]